MDQYPRRIIGFDVQAGAVDGVALCLESTLGHHLGLAYSVHYILGRPHERMGGVVAGASIEMTFFPTASERELHNESYMRFGWLDTVQDDLEGIGYATWAHGFGCL
jgi:hypothetical protein